MIYNTTTSKVEAYNGSAWEQAGGVDAFSIEYLVIAGGGGGNTNDDTTHGAGGAGGYLCNVNGENSGGNTSAQPAMFLPKSTNLQVTVGGGGGTNSVGSKSEFTSIMSIGGGKGAETSNKSGSAGSPNGRTSGGPTAAITTQIAGQGSQSGEGVAVHGSGGAGGAGANGANGTNGVGGAGGAGLSSSITGSSVTRGGGGGAGGDGTTASGTNAGGAGGGGAGRMNATGIAGTAATGGGGGGGGFNPPVLSAGAGGSGTIILRYPYNYSISFSGGAAGTTIAPSNSLEKVTTITSSGTVSWSLIEE